MKRVRPQLDSRQRSLSGSYLYAGRVVLATLAVMMLAPLAFDIYNRTKRWLLYEPEQPPPMG